MFSSSCLSTTWFPLHHVDFFLHHASCWMVGSSLTLDNIINFSHWNRCIKKRIVCLTAFSLGFIFDIFGWKGVPEDGKGVWNFKIGGWVHNQKEWRSSCCLGSKLWARKVRWLRQMNFGFWQNIFFLWKSNWNLDRLAIPACYRHWYSTSLII